MIHVMMNDDVEIVYTCIYECIERYLCV